MATEVGLAHPHISSSPVSRLSTASGNIPSTRCGNLSIGLSYSIAGKELRGTGQVACECYDAATFGIERLMGIDVAASSELLHEVGVGGVTVNGVEADATAAVLVNCAGDEGAGFSDADLGGVR